MTQTFRMLLASATLKAAYLLSMRICFVQHCVSISSRERELHYVHSASKAYEDGSVHVLSLIKDG